MSAPILYNFDLDDQCYRVKLTASILAVELEIKNVNAFPGYEHRAIQYLLMNPMGRLPILTHDERTFNQVSAMQLYLNNLSERGGHFVPSDPADYCLMLDWMLFADQDLKCASKARAMSLMDNSQDKDRDLSALTSDAKRMFHVIEDHLSEQEICDHGYVVGDTISLADIALVPAFALSRDIGIDHDEFPALSKWLRRVRSVDGFMTMPGIPDYH